MLSSVNWAEYSSEAVCCVQEEEEELKAAILNSYRLTAKKEHTRILQRRQVIEERKEQLENLNDMRVSDVDLLFFFSSFLVCRFFCLTAATSLGNKK